MSWVNSEVPHDDSTELMRNAADGDIEAFECLFRRFGPALKHFFAERGSSLTASDDLVQRIFTSLWQRREDFRADSSFETYLFTAAKYTLSKELRRSRQIVETDPENHPGCPGQFYNGLSEPEGEFYIQDLREAIEQALGKLTEAQRQALDAANACDIPLGKASEELGCSHGALRNRLKRARKRLRELLAPFLGDEGQRQP